MTKSISKISSVIKKYKTERDEYQKKVDSLSMKINILYEASQLMEREGIDTQDELFTAPTATMEIESVSEKYKDMRINDAIFDILKSHSDNYLTGKEIFNKLLKHGFQSDSKDIKRDVYNRLSKLKKTDNKLEVKDTGKLIKYKYQTNSKPTHRGHRGNTVK